MTRIEVSRLIRASPEAVWSALSDLASHHTWMAEAESLEFLSEKTSGAGTVMEVPTRVGPFTTVDIIEITGWKEGERIDAEHRGLVTGAGSFIIREHGEMTELVWAEDLTFPWWLGGAIGSTLAYPVLRRIWSGNLRRFEESLSSL